MLPYTTILFVILGLQTKHFLADFVLQNQYMLKNRSTYGHPGGILHALIHGVGSALVFIFLPVTLLWIVSLILCETLVHYHLDWFKDKINENSTLTPEMSKFWIAHGLDQLLHQATYIAIVAIFLHHVQGG